MSLQVQGVFRNGLNPIYAPDTPVQAVADIVLVHGLFGHPWKTWASKSVNYSVNGAVKESEEPFWPKTLLPAAIPNARIWSFGYDADVGKFMSTAGLNTVSQHGTNLLGNLADLLEDTVRRLLPLRSLLDLHDH